jgi:hypothetical protein
VNWPTALVVCVLLLTATPSVAATAATAPSPHASATATGCAPLAPVPTTTPTPGSVADPPGPPEDDTVTVDLGRPHGALNEGLLGVVWNSGSDLSPLAPLSVPTVRIDGSLQNASTGPDQLDLGPLLAKVAEVRSIGAEPLVLLSYMPRWLGQPRAGTTGDPTRYGPYDLDAWQQLITQVVRTLATAPEPAYRFEVWNEPDIPIFWADTHDEFIQTALRDQRAVQQVAAETGLPLQIGGPASAFGFPAWLVPWLTATAAQGLPLDFISWHHYANTPYLGPDGPEGNLPIAVYEALAKRNPNSTPLDYSTEVAKVKSTVDGALAGSGLSPSFSIDEWNVSAGGYDVRHDDAEGASLIAGILVEMQRSGLGSADLYRAVSGSSGHIGDWGMLTSDGLAKPVWWVFRAWKAMHGSRLSTSGADAASGLWSEATRDRRGCVDVLLANFVATGSPARLVHVVLDNKKERCPGVRSASLAVLDSTSNTLAQPHQITMRPDRTFHVAMKAQSVALLRIACG